jgi:hypothetical protein
MLVLEVSALAKYSIQRLCRQSIQPIVFAAVWDAMSSVVARRALSALLEITAAYMGLRPCWCRSGRWPQTA